MSLDRAALRTPHTGSEIENGVIYCDCSADVDLFCLAHAKRLEMLNFFFLKSNTRRFIAPENYK